MIDISSIRSHKFNEEEMEFIRDHVEGTPMQQLTDEFNQRFNKSYAIKTIRGFCYRNGFKNGIDSRLNGIIGKDTRFKKGHENPWKGARLEDTPGFTREGIERMRATQFKKGQRPHNYRPLGSKRLTVDGYYEIKTAEPNKWELLHRVLWREAYGEIPKGMNVVFADGDSQNLRLENLVLVDKAVNSKRRKYGKPADSDIGHTIIALSELDIAIERKDGKKKRRRKQ